MDHKPPLISIIVPCFNEDQNIENTATTLAEKLDKLSSEKIVDPGSFIYFVDDGSNDKTWSKIKSFGSLLKNVRGLKLSRNFGHQVAILAGLNEVVNLSDASISIDADLQQDINSFELFIAEFQAGADVVLGVRRSRSTDSFLKKTTANFYYWITGKMGLNLVPNHADYRLLSQKASKALLLFQEPHVFLRGLVLELGFNVAFVPINVVERKFGSTKYSFSKMISLAVDGITSFSVLPLRLTLFFGFICFIFSVLMSIFIVFEKIVFNATVPGWASTVIPIYFIGGIQLLCLGLIGEYLGKVFISVKKRPRWITQEKF